MTIDPQSEAVHELQESVRILFRSVSCTAPDVEHIIHVSLYADGFGHSRALARKMAVLYRLAAEQLSEHHPLGYWGLRSMIKVLRIAGRMRLVSDRNLSDYVIVVRALCHVNLPLLNQGDNLLFRALIKDLFPGVDCSLPGRNDLRSAISHCINEETGNVLIPAQLDKLIELHEVTTVSKATVLIGPTDSGKTVLLSTLIRVKNHMGTPTKCLIINPKACSVNELFGNYEDEREEGVGTAGRTWSDGLFASLFREVNKINSGRRETQKHSQKPQDVVICFDGDIDPVWIEALSNVMDDNRLLTLGNGDRIPLRTNCQLVFEVGHLQHASPAFISRTGIVYLNRNDLGYTPYFTRWLTTTYTERALVKKLQRLFKSLLVPCLEFIVDGGNLNFQRVQIKCVITQTELGFVRQLCEIFAMLYPGDAEWDEEVVECLFIQCLYASCGSIIAASDRPLFDEFIKGRLLEQGRPIVRDNEENPALPGQIPSAMPTLYDYFFDAAIKKWIAWKWIVPHYIHNAAAFGGGGGHKLDFYDIHVPTPATVQLRFYLDRCCNRLARQWPVLLVGDTGTGKTSAVTNYLRNLDAETNVNRLICPL